MCCYYSDIQVFTKIYETKPDSRRKGFGHIKNSILQRLCRGSPLRRGRTKRLLKSVFHRRIANTENDNALKTT